MVEEVGREGEAGVGGEGSREGVRPDGEDFYMGTKRVTLALRWPESAARGVLRAAMQHDKRKTGRSSRAGALLRKAMRQERGQRRAFADFAHQGDEARRRG